MKKIFRTICAAAVALAALASCDQENIKSTYSPEQENEVSFAAKVYTNTAIPAGTDTVNIVLTRNNAAGSLTVPLSSTMPAGVSVPSSVEFSDGEYQTNIVLNLSLEIGVPYAGTISIADTMYYNKNVSLFPSISVTLQAEYNWISLGKGQILDQMTYALDLDGDGYFTTAEEFGIQDVEILKAEGFERWRIVDPFANRDLIKKGWGNESVSATYSSNWDIYLLEDGVHVYWDGAIAPGVIYSEEYGEYQYVHPAAIESLKPFAEDVMYFEPGIFQLNPGMYLPSIKNNFTTPGTVYVSLPGVDLAAELEL